MIAPDRIDSAGGLANGAALPAGLPATASVIRRSLPGGESLEIVIVPRPDADHAPSDATRQGTDGLSERLRAWVTAGSDAPSTLAGSHQPLASSVVVVPLYDCLVVWVPGRAALAGRPDTLGQLEAAVVEFAAGEAELRLAESRAAALLDAVVADAAGGFSLDGEPATDPAAPADRYREAVALARSLSLIAPAVHAPPLHPPTLASQLGERLRDRTRLVERHGLAVERAEFIERTTEARAHRALEVGVARRQTGLEWAIVVLLVVQTALLLVDLLARRGTP